jgi:AcrR family transcriptional regulator
MPRPKVLPDSAVLKAAYALVHRDGPDALTFSTLAQACGLSASTLVQRFKSKAELVRSTLSYAWDGLDEKTATFSAKVAKTPAGAIQLLTHLSKDYGEIEAYADALLILREDLRDPALRARGAKWKAVLTRALEDCFATEPQAPQGIGLLMAAQWQGSVLWWSFDPKGKVETYVKENLERFVSAVVGDRHAKLARKTAAKSKRA